MKKKTKKKDDRPKIKRIIEHEDELILPAPVISYEPIVSMEERKAFNGKVVPIPFVLLEYLHEAEIKVIAVILDQIRKTGSCIVRGKTLSKMLGMSTVSVYVAIGRLKRMHIIESRAIGRQADKSINFKVVQYLKDVSENMKPGAVAGLRRLMKDRDLSGGISSFVLDRWLDKYSYKDEVEDEEYI